jgi:hypothetical protein
MSGTINLPGDVVLRTATAHKIGFAANHRHRGGKSGLNITPQRFHGLLRAIGAEGRVLADRIAAIKRLPLFCSERAAGRQRARRAPGDTFLLRAEVGVLTGAVDLVEVCDWARAP